MRYKPDFEYQKDYMQEMIDAKNNNDRKAFNAAQTARNKKIQTLGLPYEQTNEKFNTFRPGTSANLSSTTGNGIDSGISPGNGITPTDRQRASSERLANSVMNRMSGVPSAQVPAQKPPVQTTPQTPVKNTPYKPYNPDMDYSILIDYAVKNGNYALAAEYERLRNMKIGDMGIEYSPTDMFNYMDRKGYGGKLESLYNQIEDYNNQEFKYDYESDPIYRQILAQQKKDAQTQYENGLAELSQRFGGDVPANLIGGLLKTRQETIDAADNYIPQLWEMARNMWMNEGDQLYSQYDLTSMLADEDYNKWKENRDFITAGNENEYARNIDERNFEEDVNRYERSVYENDRDYDENLRRYNQEYDRGILESDRNYDRGVLESDRNYERGVLESDRNYDRGVLESDRDYERRVAEYEDEAAYRDKLFEWEVGKDERDFLENAYRFNVEAGTTKNTVKKDEIVEALGEYKNVNGKFVFVPKK